MKAPKREAGKRWWMVGVAPGLSPGTAKPHSEVRLFASAEPMPLIFPFSSDGAHRLERKRPCFRGSKRGWGLGRGKKGGGEGTGIGADPSGTGQPRRFKSQAFSRASFSERGMGNGLAVPFKLNNFIGKYILEIYKNYINKCIEKRAIFQYNIQDI